MGRRVKKLGKKRCTDENQEQSGVMTPVFSSFFFALNWSRLGGRVLSVAVVSM